MSDEFVKIKLSMTFVLKGNLDESETFLANLKAITNPSKFIAEAHIVPPRKQTAPERDEKH